MEDGITLFQILSQYPEASLVFIGWPLVFIWLLWFTMQQNAKREERLISANEKFSAALDKMAEKVGSRIEGLS